MAKPTVYVVENDSLVRESIVAALTDDNLKVEAYESPLDLLGRNAPLGHGCLVLGTSLPDMTALELRQKLLERGESQPFIIVVAHGSVASAIVAMRQGAADVLELPFRYDRLRRSVRMAIISDRTNDHRLRQQQLIESLTAREKEIMIELLSGAHSKKVARRLGISPKTVHVHQSHILKKMRVQSVAELIARFKWIFAAISLDSFL